jgi:isopropylmalate/homocitrate/citramalate synthase
MLKDVEIYNIFDTEALLDRPATVAVDSHSGLAGVAHWVNSYFRIKDKDLAVKKTDTIVTKIKEVVDKEYAKGRNTVMGDYELENILKQIDYEENEKLNHRHIKKKK